CAACAGRRASALAPGPAPSPSLLLATRVGRTAPAQHPAACPSLALQPARAQTQSRQVPTQMSSRSWHLAQTSDLLRYSPYLSGIDREGPIHSSSLPRPYKDTHLPLPASWSL